MRDFLPVIIYLVALKAILVGSEYNFYYRYKYGAEYERWYNGRPTFKDYLDKKSKLRGGKA
jgi:hypothetical protein